MSTIYNAMVAQDVAVVSLLADMGSGLVKDPVTDLPLVTGRDDPISTAGRIIYWDTEWRWDATYSMYPHQALGGHLVNLGLTEAHQIREEYTYPIMQWAHQQGGISGFAHMQYLGDGFPQTLNCCIPLEYPVEVALGTADYISEDVNGSGSFIDAYYRLLNCGFRPGFAAGSDFPCGQVVGPMLTYGQVAGGQLTYRGWVDAIARGRTVVSRNGRNEFLDLRVNGTATPGDEIQLTAGGDVSVSMTWTAKQSLSGTIELVSNGTVVASQAATAAPGTPGSLTATVSFPTSGWLCARVMGGGGHTVHTAAVFVTVNGVPVRASAEDAQYYVDWIDNLIENTSPGGVWNSYFVNGLAAAQARYQAAKTIYQQIAAGGDVAPLVVWHMPASGATAVPVGASVTTTFSEALDASTVTTATFLLKDATNNPVAAGVTYDAGLRRATLTASSSLGYSTTYTATVKGGSTDPRIKDPAGTALAADSVWSFTTAAQDLTPPTVSSTSPTSGAGSVVPSVRVTATFSEALDASTVSTAAFLLQDASSNPVAASVTYDAVTHTAILTPSSALAESTTYTATLKGGSTDPRIKDLAGNALATDFGWSFMVTGYNCPCTIWDPGTTVVDGDASDSRALEIGVRLRTEVAGQVTGIRFYKWPSNTGVHVGRLWSSTGTLLATTTFSGETASGWQQATLSPPVALTPNVSYVVSVYLPNGHYAFSGGYFASTGVDRPPLHAPRDGVDGANGVYYYAAGGGFPNATYNSANYWVDLVFDTNVGPDLTPPTVTSRTPGPGASGAAVTVGIAATFSEALDPATVTGSTFELRDPSDTLVPGTVAWSSGALIATLTPSSALAYSTTYIATITGGTSGVKDLAGNVLVADVSWSFTTQAPPPPPPTEGPGGPILVISVASNPFSRYFVEILRAEGLNEFAAMDLSAVNSTVLNNYDVVILGEMALTSGQVTMLTDWTNLGGTLIAMRPDAQLAGLLGLTPAAGTLADKYLLVNTASGPGVGIVGQTIQFHGTADLYTLSGASSVATLYSTATTATSNPAVTLRNVGSNGGKALAFTYDLARSVVYTRQGNPAWSGQKRDGQIPPIRSDDLFYPDWIDLNKVAIPQADEQQRLLANAITLGNLHRMPLPRFWYLPKGLKAAIVMTGDDHGSSGEVTRFENNLARDPVGCSLDDWECVRSSMYLYPGGGLTNTQAASYTSQGFEVGRHIDTGCANWTPTSLEATYTSQLAGFATTYPSVPAQVSNRTHCIAWSDWATQAEVEAAHGIRLDTNYYYWPPTWVAGRSGMFTGSGMPMRFAKLDGSMIDCYQATTQLPDESGFSFPAAIDALLSKAVGAEGYYGVFTMNMHAGSETACNAIITSAQAQSPKVPVVSAKQMLTWLDGRNGSSFGSLVWSSNALSFTIAAAAGSRNLRAMLPTLAAVGQLTGITRNSTPIAYTTQTVKGIAYAFFPGDAGDYVAQYGTDTTSPLISAVTATPHDDGTATISWTTNEASDSRVDYGTSQSSLDLNASDAALVTSHSLVLSGLAVCTTYYYRVTSTDAANNPATAPPLTSDPLSFATPGTACFRDQTAAQFGQGTLDANTVITTTGDGEVMLKGALDQEFSGSSLPGDWTSVTWESGGAVTVSGGMATVDAARITPTSLTGYGPGRALEFVATFAATANQHIGLADGDNTTNGMFSGVTNWVMFSTWNVAGPNLYARLAIAGTQTNLSLGTGYLGSPHLYRIEWNSGSVVFKIDGVTVQTQTATIAALLRPGVSDYTVGTPLPVDWLRMTPYASSGSFLSSVHDGGGPTSWVSASWNASVPAGTSLSMSVRGGNSSNTSDPSWTTYQSIPASGGSVGICSRYVQYRADLSTTNVTIAPALQDVSLTCASVGVAGDPVTGLASTLATSGNDASGRIKTVVTWSGGGGGGGGVKVYRKGYSNGSYPAYPTLPTWPPVAPASPAAAVLAGWTLTEVDASGEADQPLERDYWSYVAFNTDACGSNSTASNVTGGTLDYLLGDVSDGTETLCAGDNAVNGVDVSLLGTHYGAAKPALDYLPCLDVGPTVGYSVTGRPVPDGLIEFEDLVMFALNFGRSVGAPLAQARPARAEGAAAGADALALELPELPAVGGSFTVLVRATLGGTIQALKLELGYDRAAVEMEGVEAGELLGRQGAQALVLTPGPGRVDVALLGPGAGLFGSGELVRVRFRVKAAGAAGLALRSAEGRDGANRKVALNGQVGAMQPQLPTKTWFSAPMPNPFAGTTTLSFALARGGAVELGVYGIDGRKVATLVAESREPGQYQVNWDGRDGTGQAVRPGMYYARLTTPEGRFTRTLVLMK